MAFAAIALLLQVHTTPMAGRCFPADPAMLDAQVTRAWSEAARNAANVPPRSGLLALIAPHAGLDYSGVTAAAAYRLIGAAPRAVIVLGFRHRVPLEGIAAVDVERYTLPGGAAVPVDRAAARALGFPLRSEHTLCDHSLENQLPSLRCALPGTPVIPLYVGHLDAPAIAAAARLLADRVRGGDLLIGSSDFTHHGPAYGYAPFREAGESLRARLAQRAEEAFETIGSLNAAALDRYLAETGDTICGRDPIRLLMATLAQLHGGRIYMTNAGYATGADSRNNVGYGALAFSPASAFQVDAPARRTLLRHARATLEADVDGAPRPLLTGGAPGWEPQRMGAFVTIRKGRELRGCVVVLTPRESLGATVASRAIAAAKSDPRFPRLTRAEFPVSLEVSLLTPLKRLMNWRDWRPGLGAVLTLGEAGGLLLPQVAQEMRWGREEFLAGLAQKAGLPPAAYRDRRAKLYVSEAQVFGE
ncbi:MAG: AmmeMemoRadiSam system protein B [Acidobacteria bacterium]|nr:AmmeMemoRadiSam system protein B [Acidobacteriota bacterium]